MDMFAEGVQNLLRDDCSKKWLRHNPNDDHNLKELKENVTVALIDDGVDFMNRILADNLGAGRSFNTPKRMTTFSAHWNLIMHLRLDMGR